ncbi:MAG TPA: 5-oxoprolinase subunit PxpA [Gemmatales bacterium]|nr:5-oxoprolinase subunit PxpA [Gemmatales bacterium]
MLIDFNADIAEGCPHDAELMQYVQSVNIACATHAGSPAIMVQALREAKARNLRVGAHPGYFDREHFGRTELPVTADELYQIVIYQLGALQTLATEVGMAVSYVKPHGAMYHQVGRDQALAEAVAMAARKFGLAVMGLPDSQLEDASSWAGIQYLREGFADRRYRPDGSLVPRTEPNAMIHDPVQALRQIHWLMETVDVVSICVHGDEPEAVRFLREMRRLLDTPLWNRRL